MKADKDRQGKEIEALQREMSALLATNSSLRSQVENSAKVVGTAARDENRRLLEDQVLQLHEKVRGLEHDKMNLTQQLTRLEEAHSQGRQVEATFALTSVMRERDDLAHKLALEETRRKSSDARIAMLEGELRSAKLEVEELRKKLPSLEAERVERDLRGKRQHDELESYARLLDQARVSREDQERKLLDCQGLLAQYEGEVAKIRSENDIAKGR